MRGETASEMVAQGRPRYAKVRRMNSDTQPKSGGEAREAEALALPAGQLLRFGDFEFDEHRGELRCSDGRCLHLRPRVETLLRLFLGQPGRLMKRDELTAALWPSTVVTEDSLVQCVGELRSLLDDGNQRIVQTVRGRGYRWESPVERVSQASQGDRPALVNEGASPGHQALGDTGRPGPNSPEAPARARSRSLVVAAVAVTALALVAWASRSSVGGGAVSIDEALATLSSVAVMPFEVNGREPADRFLADRFADAVTAQFATRRGMRGLGRAATSPYASASPDAIAQGLKARLMLTGQIGLVGEDRVAVDVQLHSTADGSIVWRRHLDARVDDAAARDELGQLVVNAVRNRSLDSVTANDASSRDIPNAAKLTLLGWRDLDIAGGSVDNNLRARSRFEEALREDPRSIIASNGLAATYVQELRRSDDALTPQQIARYEDIIERTLAMAPDEPTALLLWGSAQIRRGNAELAIPALEKAIAIVPSYPNGYLQLSLAKLLTGHAQEVQGLADKVIARGEGDPRHVSDAYLLAAEAALLLANDEKASVLAKHSIAASPANVDALALLAAIQSLQGHESLAHEQMAEYLKRRPKASVAGYDRSHPSADPTYVAQRARLYAGLEKAGLPLR